MLFQYNLYKANQKKTQDELLSNNQIYLQEKADLIKRIKSYYQIKMKKKRLRLFLKMKRRGHLKNRMRLRSFRIASKGPKPTYALTPRVR